MVSLREGTAWETQASEFSQPAVHNRATWTPKNAVPRFTLEARTIPIAAAVEPEGQP